MSSRKQDLLLRMRPLQRVGAALCVTAICFLSILNVHFGWWLKATILWDVFAITSIFTSWWVFYKRPAEEIRNHTSDDDLKTGLMLTIIIVIISFAGLLAVLVLLLSKDTSIVTLLTAVTAIILSWIMVHTLFTFHYAHMYYADYENKKEKGPYLEFPKGKGAEEPDYLDFAYFSFVIGMTFQVSDVEISSRLVRRMVLTHSLLAFALNTFVIALSINLVAGLRK